MAKLDYVSPLIQWITMPNEDVIRTSTPLEDGNAGYAWGSDWSQAFGDGNE